MNYKSFFLTLALVLAWFACVNEDDASLTPPSVQVPERTLEIQGLASLKIFNSTTDQNPSFSTDTQIAQHNNLSFTERLFGISEIFHQGLRIQLQQKMPENDRTEFEIDLPSSFIDQIDADKRVVLFAQVYQDAGNEILDFFMPISSQYNPGSGTLTSTLPRWIFTNKRGPSSNFEARLLVKILDESSLSQDNNASARIGSSQCESDPICCPLGGDLCASSRVISDFLSPTIENGVPRVHTGIDYAVPEGHPIVAVNDGIVIQAGEVPGYQNTIAIRHSNGTTSVYAFLSEILVSRGETVRSGELIGRSGSRGSGNEPHLHFEYIKTGNPFSGSGGQEPIYIDPSPCMLDECGKAPAELNFTLESASESGLAGKEGEKLNSALVVKLTEEGEPIGGKKIEWAVTEGGGELEDIQNFTSSDGISTASIIVGAGDKQTVTATYQDQVVTFDIRRKQGVMKLHSGDEQTGSVKSQSAEPLVIELTEDNNPFPGESITWSIVQGDGALTEETTTTDEEGLAKTHYVFGDEGESIIRASYEDQTVDFTLTAAANVLSIVSGNSQRAIEGRKLFQPMVVKVANQQEEGIEGASISWSMVRGDGVLVDMKRTTDETGLASASLVMGSDATQIIRASYGDQEVDFEISKGSIKLEIISGNNQKAIPNREIPEPLVVRLIDQDDNPLEGEEIEWRRVAGDGTVTNTQSTTNEEGKSTTSFIMGTQETQVIRASYGNTTSDFTITRNELKLVIVSGNNQTADVGQKLRNDLVVRLLDGENNPIPDEDLRWERKVGNGSLEIITSTTDEDGKVTANFIVGTDQEHIVSVTVPGTNVQIEMIIKRLQKNLVILSGNNQTAVIGEKINNRLEVKLEDEDGRGLPNEPIVWEILRGNGELVSFTELTNSFGVANAQYIMGEARIHTIKATFEEQEVIFNLEREYIAPEISFYEVSIVDTSELVPSITPGTATSIIFSFFYEDKDGDLLSTDHLGVKRLNYNVYCTSGCEDNFQGRVRWSGGTIPIDDPRGVVNFHNGDDYSGSFGLSRCSVGGGPNNVSNCKNQVWEVTIVDRAGNESNVAVAVWDGGG
ncbi:hypothetical protein ADIS_1715 [Lunatimonas lonarensis]|uniref:M23ase beta-sheet core domain-containing protein n=1 Tax=Lunatimonas lonarensis TaxID=1232681 RepID=R7ZUG1_9BACT|nr:peptidoglycan DD-metalloendopeptidase family protein [Lunatimonas lonarensis]EON77796.1 hypothetical protein ADIS_1715 [Lunatimonas lonarensis]